MSALAIIIIAGGIIALFAWLFWKAAHADPAETERLEEEAFEILDSLPDTIARESRARRSRAEADAVKAVAYYALFNK